MKIVKIIETVGAYKNGYTVVYASEKVRRREFIRKSLTDKEFDFYINSSNVERTTSPHMGTVKYVYR